MAQKSIFARIGDWFKEQVTQFRIQGIIAERGSLSSDYMERQDREFSRIDNQQNLDPYDKAMQKYSHRLREVDRLKSGNIPEYDRVGDLNGDLMNELGELDESSQERFKKDPYSKGFGIGAFFGRLFSGRLSQEARQRDGNIFARLHEETLFDNKESWEVYRLKQNEQEIRNGTMTVKDALTGPEKAKRPVDLNVVDFAKNVIAEYEQQMQIGVQTGIQQPAAHAPVPEELDAQTPERNHVPDDPNIDDIEDLTEDIAFDGIEDITDEVENAHERVDVSDEFTGSKIETPEQESLSNEAPSKTPNTPQLGKS